MVKDFRKNPPTSFKAVDSISKKEAAEEAASLRDGITYHDCLYYVKNKPVISDKVYDKLIQRLVELEEAFPDLKSKESPPFGPGWSLSAN